MGCWWNSTKFDRDSDLANPAACEGRHGLPEDSEKQMLASIKSILEEQCKIEPGLPILVGVSGGPDSLCLLSVLKEAGCRLVAAHFNHMLRPEAEGEAAAVEALAGELGIPFDGGGGDVRQYAEQAKVSIETAARELRYQFLFARAHYHGAQAVAVGHTADDQVETVLMHFVRGAGLNGLKGMGYRGFLASYDEQIPLIRPLLDTWRAETVAYCTAHGLRAHYDATNDSLDFVRNRLRHELIPSLESYNPRFREAVWRASKTLTADHDLLRNALEPLWLKSAVAANDIYVALDAAFLTGMEDGLQMHVIRRAVQHLIPEHDTGFAELQRAITFIKDVSQDRTDFAGGVSLLREADLIYVTTNEKSLPTDQWPQMPDGMESLTIDCPSHLDLANGWQFSAVVCKQVDLPVPNAWEGADRFHVFLDARGLPPSLELRVRKPGDRLTPLGMEGHSKKLSDLFVDSKLPTRVRGRWPLVCSGEEVIWVPGYAPAERHRLCDDSTEVLCLSVEPPV